MINTESLTAAQQQFTSRFSPEHWQDLCRDEKFSNAVANAEFDAAEVVAWIKLNDELNSPAFDRACAALAARELEHSRVCEFVRIWAGRTGRTGKDGKQSRQAHIRKLMKHGLTSDYFRKMAVEAGLA